MDYTQLVSNKSVPGSICNWINRDTTDGPTILTEAQAFVYTRLRHWRMKYRLSGSLVVDQGTIPLPADFADASDFRLIGTYTGRLRRGDERYIHDRWAWDAAGARVKEAPEWYFVGGTELVLDTHPDQAYSYLLTYYQVPEDLGADNLTNWLTRFHPRLLRSACMLMACEFEKEAGQGNIDRTYWEQIFEAERQEVQAKSDIVARASDAPVEFA